jgi:DNA-directed RNA polymerase specialized sigma24 family protein
MLTEAHYRAVLNFFYFLLLDEGMAISAAFKTMKQVQKITAKKESPPVNVALIKTMCAILDKYKEKQIAGAGTPPHSDWKSSKQEYLVAWKEFMRRSELPVSVALVLRYILDYSPQLIAQALEIPEGTVYFRLGRGLESFGDSPVLPSAGKK